MKLSPEHQRWFSSVQHDWRTKIQPGSSPLGRHVFDVADHVPDSAVSRARLFASRLAALATFPAGGVVAEVGTQSGWFARRILDRIGPKQLHLFDLEFDTLRAHHPEIAADERVVLHLGDSSTNLATFADHTFDWIYVDGDHEIAGVRRDAEQAVRTVRADGILVFNDYTVWSPLELTDYGVVPIVNDLLAGGEWEAVYLALHPLMYCDLAIRRTPTTQA